MIQSNIKKECATFLKLKVFLFFDFPLVDCCPLYCVDVILSHIVHLCSLGVYLHRKETNHDHADVLRPHRKEWF
jgi:hypothetical protein